MRRIDLRSIGAISIIGLVLCLAALPMPAAAQVNTITVAGVGTAATQPDIATFEVGVEVVNTNLDTGFQSVNATLTAINTVLAEQGVALADIQTLGISILPEDRIDPRVGPSGNFIFRIRNTLRVTVRDVAKVAPILAGVVDAGANVVANFAFGLQDLGKAEQAAREAAIANARERAEGLAKQLNVVVGDPVIATEQVTTAPLSPAPVGSGSRGASLGTQEVPLNAGQFIVTVQVQVTFTLRTAAPAPGN